LGRKIATLGSFALAGEPLFPPLMWALYKLIDPIASERFSDRC
jgi:hypothetical protein